MRHKLAARAFVGVQKLLLLSRMFPSYACLGSEFWSPWQPGCRRASLPLLWPRGKGSTGQVSHLLTESLSFALSLSRSLSLESLSGDPTQGEAWRYAANGPAPGQVALLGDHPYLLLQVLAAVALRVQSVCRFGLASLLLFISSALDSRSRTSVKPLSESAGRRVRGAGKGGALPAPPAPPYTSPRLVSFPLRLLQCLSQLLLSAEGRDGTPRLLFNADSSPREIALGSWCCPVPRHISDSAHLQNLLRAPLRLKSPRPRPGGAAPLRRQPASARSQQPPVRCTPRPEPEPDEKEKERERESLRLKGRKGNIE